MVWDTNVGLCLRHKDVLIRLCTCLWVCYQSSPILGGQPTMAKEPHPPGKSINDSSTNISSISSNIICNSNKNVIHCSLINII